MKLWLIDSIDLDFNQCSPEVIVAGTEPDAKARYMKEHPISFYSVSAYELDKIDGWNIALHREQAPRKVATGVGNSEYFVCGNCRRPIDKGDNFCRTCGVKVIWEE